MVDPGDRPASALVVSGCVARLVVIGAQRLRVTLSNYPWRYLLLYMER